MCVHAGMVELGSDASAACGGLSELSAWPRSVRDAGDLAKDIRRVPQQEDSVDLGNLDLPKQRYKKICGHGGIGRLGGFRFHCESVQVRVLLPAPYRVFVTDLTVVDTRFSFSVSIMD